MMSWGGWLSECHYDYEQVQRIQAAQDKKISKEIISLDKDAPRIKIQGSGAEPYTATLTECSCPDFLHRQAPCKHIYRLALELGLLSDMPAYDKGGASYDTKQEIQKYRELYKSGQLPADAYVAICKALSKL